MSFVRCKWVALVFAIVSVAPCFAGETVISAVALKKVKAASVFVKLLNSTGSGFLVHKEGTTGFIATNAHVVAGAEPRVIHVVFDSGTAQERSAFATIAAESVKRDLAILKVSLPDLPTPLTLAGPNLPVIEQLPVDGRAPKPLGQKQSVFVCGFPYGSALAAGGNSPEITIARGEIRNIETRDAMHWVAIDGDVNPGNSGGPVVDEQGVVQGVTTLKLMGQKSGQAVPASDVFVLLQWCQRGNINCSWLPRQVVPNPAINRPAKEVPPADKSPQKQPALPVIFPTATGLDLAGTRADLAGGTLSLLRINAEKVLKRMTWSRDGTHVYIAESTGRIRKVAVPSLREERSLALGLECTSIGLSAEGLVVVAGRQEIRVLDEDTLEMKLRIPVKNAPIIATSPSLSEVFTSQFNNLISFNLVTGIQSGSYPLESLGAPDRYHAGGRMLDSFLNLYVSRDAKSLFVKSSGCIHRFSISPYLTYEEVGPQIGVAASFGDLEISADSSYIAWAYENAAVFDHPKTALLNSADGRESRGVPTYIYKSSNLQLPVITLTPPSGSLRTLGFDKKAGCIYALNDRGELFKFNTRGMLEKTFELPKAIGRLNHSGVSGFDFGAITDHSQLLPHPDGNKVLVLADKVLLWLELP